MADIKFYIPKGHTIPLRLQVYVDDDLIEYERVRDGFIFYTQIKDKEKALKVVKEIINKIKEENDEVAHGVWWETISLEFAEQEERYYVGEILIWYYHIKDIY